MSENNLNEVIQDKANELYHLAHHSSLDPLPLGEQNHQIKQKWQVEAIEWFADNDREAINPSRFQYHDNFDFGEERISLGAVQQALGDAESIEAIVTVIENAEDIKYYREAIENMMDDDERREEVEHDAEVINEPMTEEQIIAQVAEHNAQELQEIEDEHDLDDDIKSALDVIEDNHIESILDGDYHEVLDSEFLCCDVKLKMSAQELISIALGGSEIPIDEVYNKLSEMEFTTACGGPSARIMVDCQREEVWCEAAWSHPFIKVRNLNSDVYQILYNWICVE